MRLFRSLQDAFWDTSARNAFEAAIKKIKWNSAEWNGDEWVFRLGKQTFTTPSLNPVDCLHQWSPAVQLASGKWVFIFV